MFPDDPEDPRPPEECLPDAAEDLLLNWPLPSKSDNAWKALASAIDGKVRITQKGSTADELLEAPLADEERDVQRRSHPRMKRPSAGNLAILARAKLGESAPGQAQNRDAADERSELARALLSQAVKARSEAHASTPGAPTSARAPVTLAELVNSSSQRKTAALRNREGAVTPAPVPALPERARSQERRMWLGVAFGVAGMAAAGIMYLGAGQPGLAESQLRADDASHTLPASTPTSTSVARADAPGAGPRTAAHALEKSVSVEEIPVQESAGSNLDPSQTPTTVGGTLAPRGRVGLDRRAQPARTENAGAARAAAEPTQAEPPAGDTAEAPPASGPSEPGMVMADSRHGGIPDKPSTGAVQAAIGSVMGVARACVAGQSAASRASVEFGSDGRVRSVNISGPAVGTHAEPCLRTALSGARVQPFSRSNYLVNLSIRPL